MSLALNAARRTTIVTRPVELGVFDIKTPMQLAMDVCSRAGQVAAVPARYRFAVPLSLE